MTRQKSATAISLSTRRILLLGMAVMLIGSTSPFDLRFGSTTGNVAYAQDVDQQVLLSDPTAESAVQEAIRMGHGKVELMEGYNDADEGIISAEVNADRRPLIAVPVLVQIGTHGELPESATSGGVRYELDHQVPPPEILAQFEHLQQQQQQSNGELNINIIVRRENTPEVDQQSTVASEIESTVVSHLIENIENPAIATVVTAAPTMQDVHATEPMQDRVSSDKTMTTGTAVIIAPLNGPIRKAQDMVPSPDMNAVPETKPKAETILGATSNLSNTATHIESDPGVEVEKQAIMQGQEFKGEEFSRLPSKEVDLPKSTSQSIISSIDSSILMADPSTHAILDASAEDFGPLRIPSQIYGIVVGTGSESKIKKLVKDQEEADSEIIDKTAKTIFEQNRAHIEAELESYKSRVSSNDDQEILTSEEMEDSVTLSIDDIAEPVQNTSAMDGEDGKYEENTKLVISTEGKPIVVNKLNKNHDGYDGSEEASSGDGQQPQVLMHHHHRHISRGSPKQTQKQEQKQYDKQESSNNVIAADDDRPLVFTSIEQEISPVIHKQLDQTVVDDDEDDNDDGEDYENEEESVAHPTPPPVFPPPPVPSEEIRNRGLIPSVKGAHHCTPQFCVNVSLTNDGQFATFHIERSMDETGWISLGIGYAMTTADLLIMWPNKDPASGGGPRGATLSRRTSHAYIEPHLVSREETEIRASGKSESLYPENEYILHNPSKKHNNGEVAMAAATQIFPAEENKFIVQFTRPVRTQNRVHKLTPGKEQDFCWAYSPMPISADSVGDPGAHITQHLSVGTFAMDVGANQPQLKEVILKQQELDAQEAIIEKERKKWALEESNRKLNEEEKQRIKSEKEEKHKISAKHKEKIDGPRKGITSGAWLHVVGYSSGLSSSTLVLQGFSFLVAVGFMWFFR
ncbi:hypothetical protein FBU30_004085 [Linnemannia zychae]|nr:hypothetical protein FBU30_004085 [Linnemannia zychae]